jgi:hypothetical protein
VPLKITEEEKIEEIKAQNFGNFKGRLVNFKKFRKKVFIGRRHESKPKNDAIYASKRADSC